MTEAKRLPRLPSSGPLAAFEVLAPLGEGGMASVYRVRERATGRELALKLMRDPQRSATRRERFAREAQITAAFNHPGIVRVHGAGFAGDQGYLLCELVDGARSLDAAARERSPRERVELVRDAARALGHAHAQGVVHRDVKPDNVLVGADGRVRVADFGLASALEVERLTRSGAVLGTPHYMAPEQVTADRGRMGPPTDVWALGVVLYQVLAGQLPFAGESFVELASQITTREPERPRVHGAQVPLALEAILLKALDKEPEGRYPDGGALADDLQRYLDGQQVEASGVRQRLRRKARRVALLAVPLGLGLAALLAALAWSPQVSVRPAPNAHPPQGEAPAADAPPEPPAPAEAQEPEPEGDPLLEADLRAVEDVLPDMLMHQVRLGSPSAYAGVENMYRNGAGGVEKDIPTAVRWLWRAAEAGHPPCQDTLGSELLEGSEWIPRDEAQGLRWLERAADAGEASALRKLGEAYLRGTGTAPDRDKALELLSAAEQAGDGGARESLALALARGSLEEQRRAVKLFRIGHAKGRAFSSRWLGQLMVEGRGTEADPQGGVRVLEQVYEQGNVEAALLLGELYEGRLGIRVFPSRTHRYFSRAALMLRLEVDEGRDRALVQLAHLYWIGRGVPRDPDEALRLLDLYLVKRPGAPLVSRLRSAMLGGETLEWPAWAPATILTAR